METDGLQMTNVQREMLNQFRSNLSDILTPHHTDTILMKWLRTRNFNIKKAEEIFREVDSNRKMYGINTILDTYGYSYMSEVIQKYKAETFLGFAKDGSPVRYVTGKCDFYGFLLSSTMYELCIFCSYILESDMKFMREQSLKTGRSITEAIYILDCDGYSLSQFSYKAVIETGLDILRLFQDHYPEIWRYIIFVNAPVIFNALFNIFKPILRESLINKFKVASRDSTGELLRTYIDDDVLPAFLGGKRVDSNGDPYCKEFMSFAGKIPEKYYLKNCMHFIDETDPEVKVVVVGARSVFNVPLVTKEGGVRIRIELRTENGSISFSVLYREFDPDTENPDLPASDEYLDPCDDRCNVRVVGSKMKVQSHLAPSDGIGMGEKPGIYIMQFDNTDSWFGSRKLYYRFTVFPKE